MWFLKIYKSQNRKYLKWFSCILLQDISGINSAKKVYGYCYKARSKSCTKDKKSRKKIKKNWQKKKAAKVAKAANDLLGIKMADRHFLLRTQKLFPSQQQVLCQTFVV